MELLTPNELANNYAMLNNKQALKVIDTNFPNYECRCRLIFADLKETEIYPNSQTIYEVANNYAKLNNKQAIEILDIGFQLLRYVFVELSTIENLCNVLNKIIRTQLYVGEQIIVNCKSGDVLVSFSKGANWQFLIRNIDQSILQTDGKEDEFKTFIEIKTNLTNVSHCEMELLTLNELANNYAKLNNKQALKVIDTNFPNLGLNKLVFMDLNDAKKLYGIQTMEKVADNYAKLKNKKAVEIETHEHKIINYAFVKLTTIENLCNDINNILWIKSYLGSECYVSCQRGTLYISLSGKERYLYFIINNIDQSILQTDGKDDEIKQFIKIQFF